MLVEEAFEIETGGDRNISGRLDLADDAGRIVDFKTAARRKSQDDADTSVQLTIYSAAHKLIKGRPATGVRLDTVIVQKTKVDRQVLESERTVHDYEAVARRVNTIVASIEAGHFPPAPPGAWWCSPKWCGYYNSCPYTSAGHKTFQEFQA